MLLFIGLKNCYGYFILPDTAYLYAWPNIFFAYQYNTVEEEALSALVTLGFAKPVAAKTLDKLLQTNQNLTVESLIRAALNAL